uniref:Uncharacterized protein n=1 Tax=viral metagenome TaxID=1070528 RepID=A0A6C0AGH9_9ZZZZ
MDPFRCYLFLQTMFVFLLTMITDTMMTLFILLVIWRPNKFQDYEERIHDD